MEWVYLGWGVLVRPAAAFSNLTIKSDKLVGSRSIEQEQIAIPILE